MSWISVKDQMPIDGELVLCLIGVYYERRDTNPYFITKNVAYHCCMRNWLYVCGKKTIDESLPIMKVIYWTPIPQVPSEIQIKE